ncbi:MAG: phosphate acyltransferase PlsX [Clostridia bacterium]|nr:phosphate acyltransferase PlsX [Clostridia bacterium]
MRVIIDAFGGDYAPAEIIKGAAMGAERSDVDVILVGKRDVIKRVMDENQISDKRVEIANADEIFPMDGNPASAVKEGAETSLIKGLSMLAAGEGDAYVSAGNTGAMMLGASIIVKRVKGIRRAALATLVPCVDGNYLLLDCGATVEVSPEVLTQFGLMGSVYMEKVEGRENPRVGLVNIGSEENKGTDLLRETYQLMKTSAYNFIGNVEGRELPMGGCDVAVADGFTGNVVLKVTEGMGFMAKHYLKDMFGKNFMTKGAALMIYKGLRAVNSAMDYSTVGGAPMMGMRKPVIKAHGSSKALAICNAVRQAVLYTRNNVIGIIEESMAKEEAE